MKPDLRKPGYRLTRQAFWSSFVFAWLVILLLVIGSLIGRDGAVQIVPVVVPSMVMMIAALLGIHRFTGAMDMRSIAESGAPIDTNAPPEATKPDSAWDPDFMVGR
ncbi:MAG: NAD(P)+ transhydrogenase beta chain [Rhizobiaceae bacterium]|nr:NAD(P)+ transhydrogenase beta chain [Rhizobiaceae bacterium]